MAQLNNLLVTGDSRFINMINGACSDCYGTCTTATATVAKVATITNTATFNLSVGTTVHIKFSNYNSATNPTLNVNSTGAYPIVKFGTTAVGTGTSTTWRSGATCTLTFDGTSWILHEYDPYCVSQANVTANSNYQLLMSAVSGTDTDTQYTTTTKSSKLYYNPSTGKLYANSSEVALKTNIPSSATSSTTGISIADHSATTIYGVKSSTTTASKVTLGTSFTVPNVTSAGSASTWVFEDITVPKAASSATSIPNVTAAGEGDFTATVTNGVLSFSHTHTPPTFGNTISVTGVSGSTTASHVKSGGNGTKPSLGTSFTIPNVTGNSDVTVPIKNDSATTVVTSKTHTITDNGHTHTLS